MIDKPSPVATRAFEDAFPDDPRAARRQMFGMKCGAVNGNLFAGVFEKGITARLGKARVDALVAAHEGIGPFAPGGRTWPEYALIVADRWKGSDELRGWVAEALEHTASLPPKVAKPRKAPAKKRG